MRRLRYALPFLTLIAAGALGTSRQFGRALPGPLRVPGSSPPPSARRGPPWGESQDDSARVLEAARSHQDRFERLRRSRLSWGQRGSTRRCHEIIGRYCLRHDDDEHEPLPEPEEVKRARATLIARLEAAARTLPGDEWIAGQRVRYLIEAGRKDDALLAARECRAAGWWCLALEGYALHAAGDYVTAESTFAGALRAMPGPERCRWTDIGDLLTARSRGRYGRLACEEREPFEQRFWWLADPLYLLPANDRRSEHFARRTLDRLQERASSPFGLPWGADLRELLLRYGWPDRWEKVSYATGTGGVREQIISHHPADSWQFAPDFDFLQEVGTIGPGDWRLHDEQPRSAYAPAYASSFAELQHQLAIFPRGDSAIVVAAFELELEPDSTTRAGTVEAALVLFRGPSRDPIVVDRRGAAASGALSVAVDATPALLSLEALSRAERRAARSRYGLPLAEVPRGLLALSDLLVLDQADLLPNSLAAALPQARPVLRAHAGERLGLYWEVFGLGPRPEDLSMSLRLTAEGGGWLRKAAEWLGLAGRQPSLTLAWQEAVPTPTRVLARSLAIQLPDVQPGRYTLTLEVKPFGREMLSASRSIEIRR